MATFTARRGEGQATLRGGVVQLWEGMRSGPELIRDARMYFSRRLNRSLAPPDRVSQPEVGMPNHPEHAIDAPIDQRFRHDVRNGSLHLRFGFHADKYLLTTDINGI